MLKKTVKFKDFNGVEQSEDLYFHISKTSVLTAPDPAYNDIILIGQDLQERGKLLADLKLEDIDQTDPFDKNGQLLAESLRMVARLLDRLVSLAYGLKSDDGRKFIKSAEVLSDFKNSAVYDAFVDQMITNQDEMVTFVNELLAAN